LYRHYKFLLRPTAGQVILLLTLLEDLRQLYNAALEERREAWRMGRHMIGFYDQDAQLKDIRAADPERYGRWAFSCERAAIRRLDRAFQDFYRRCKAGVKPGYPRFKGRARWDSAEWSLGCKWDSVPHPTVTRVYLKGIGHVRVHQHRAIKGRVKTIIVKREGGRWYVILNCEDEVTEPLPATGAAVGIDLGTVHYLTTSDGEHVPNPRLVAVTADRLAAAQRSLARKKRGSNRRHKAVRKVVAIHAKVRRQRIDYAHKTALALVRDHDVIVHEDLAIMNMARSPRPKPDPDQPGEFLPNGAAAKAGLNKSIYDAGWGIFLDVLRDKAESAGRAVIEVDAAYTSQRCAQCGHVAKENRPSRNMFRCVQCGHEDHADVNAAVNILRAGLVLREAQAEREAAQAAESLRSNTVIYQPSELSAAIP
jgi:putative transposase